MQKYTPLRNMSLSAPDTTKLSSVYGHSMATVDPSSEKVSQLANNASARRRARRWAAQGQTNRTINAQ